MRFEDGNTVVEIGGAGADRIEASTSVSFDWKPAAGDSYQWFRRDGSWDEESIASGSEPSTASGFVTIFCTLASWKAHFTIGWGAPPRAR